MTRRGFLAALAITCLAPLRVVTGLMKAIPVRKIPTGEFLMWSSYLPLYTTPCCLTGEELAGGVAKLITSVQPMPPNCFKDALAWFEGRR